MSITLVQKNKSKGILTWYARVPDSKTKGKIHFFSLGTISKSEAKLLMQQRIKEGAYDLKLKSLFSMRVLDITNKEISEAFMISGNKLSPVTYHNRKTVLSTFFNYLVDILEIIPHNPIRKAIPRRKIPKKKRDFWTSEQIDRIIAKAPQPRIRLLWSFMAFAGLRVSEAKAMRPEAIYDGYIHIKGKGDKEAAIPICPRLQREIDRYDRAWKFTFSEEPLRKAAAKAIPEGFPGKAHAHRFRHSFGSNLIRAGVNVKIVQTLMRHESITLTLDTYGHILDTDCEKAISKVYK